MCVCVSLCMHIKMCVCMCVSLCMGVYGCVSVYAN
jgi:hypothetical protein